MSHKYDSSQWPPPPDFGFDNREAPRNETPVKLLTGSEISDTALGVAASVCSFTLLIFVFVNPFVTLVFPPPQHFSFGLRLLTGCFLANAGQYMMWKLLRSRNFHVVGNNLALAAFPTSIMWLSLSLLMWAFG